MKKFYFFMILLAGLTLVRSQVYDEGDKAALRKFLLQKSADPSKLNIETFGISLSDTIGWKTSENWARRLPYFQGGYKASFKWDNSPVKKLIYFNIRGEFSNEEQKYKTHYLADSISFSDFKNLKDLSIEGHNISYLDVSGMTSLETLEIAWNDLETVNLLKNNNLKNLNCKRNQLKTLDLSKNVNLEKLSAYGNQLNILNTSNNINLKKIDLTNNPISILDFSKNVKLEDVELRNNQKLTSINFLNNPELKSLWITGTQVTKLDFSNNAKLEKVWGESNYRLLDLSMEGADSLKDLSFRFSGLRSIDISKNTNLESLWCDGNYSISKLDISNNLKLKELLCYWNNLSELDVSKNINLEHLSCHSNNLTSLDVTKNAKLKDLNFRSNRITTIDLSNNLELYDLYCHSNGMVSLDLSKNTKLQHLYCNNNKLKELDLSKNIELEALECESNQLTKLNTPKSTKFSTVTCQSNNLKFSDLPLISIKSYKYSPQSIIEGGEIKAGNNINLNSEYSIDGNLTSYSWYNKNNKEIQLVSAGEGIFIAPSEYIGDYLICKMTNAKFPNLTLEYKVKIIASPITLNYHLKLDADNNHLLTAGDKIKIFGIIGSHDPKIVKFGLFNPANGTLQSDLEIISVKETTYTCRIPRFLEGIFMIAAYYMVEEEPVLINREKGSPWIDRLPVQVKLNGWPYNRYIPDNSIVATNYMKLNINNKVNQLFEVEKGKEFMVYAPTENSQDTRIGLFYLKGNFYKDITVRRNPKNPSTYICIIPEDLLSDDNFILMPYSEEGGIVKIIERSSDKAYLADRLPIHVLDDDIWEFSINQSKLLLNKSDKESPLYPNPVVDILHLNIPEDILSTEIYSASGQRIKTTGKINNKKIDVKSLCNGNYILIINTLNKTNSYRFIKD